MSTGIQEKKWGMHHAIIAFSWWTVVRSWFVLENAVRLTQWCKSFIAFLLDGWKTLFVAPNGRRHHFSLSIVYKPLYSGSRLPMIRWLGYSSSVRSESIAPSKHWIARIQLGLPSGTNSLPWNIAVEMMWVFPLKMVDLSICQSTRG